MSSWDDVEVDSDGDELLDLLWDIPDRYDLGVEDDPLGAEASGIGVRKRIRRPGAPDAPLPPPPPPLLPQRALEADRPTEALPPLPGLADGGGFGAAPATILADGHGPGRFNRRDLATVAGIVVVVAAGVGIGYTMFSSNASPKSSKPSSLAITATTVTPSTLDLSAGPVGGDTTTSTSDTTTSIPPTTAPAPSSSVPAVVAATTSTTAVRHCVAVKMSAILPVDTPLDSSSTATTIGSTTTTASSTTTTTTVPDTTTTKTVLTLPPPRTTTTAVTAPPPTSPPPTAPPRTVCN